MGEEALNLRHASTTFPGGRPIVLWLVAAGHVVFAAICSPQGIRSGDWSVPWLPNADALVFVASGATLVYPLILFPLWTALGRGAGMRRVAASFLLCLAFVVAVVVRGMFRDIHEPQILPAAFGMVSFLLVSLCLWGPTFLEVAIGHLRRSSNTLPGTQISSAIPPETSPGGDRIGRLRTGAFPLQLSGRRAQGGGFAVVATTCGTGPGRARHRSFPAAYGFCPVVGSGGA